MSRPDECFKCGATAPDTEQTHTTDRGGELEREWRCGDCGEEWSVLYELTEKHPLGGVA